MRSSSDDELPNCMQLTESPLPLQIILGNVNVSILNRNDKVRYKDDYEKFKLILNGIGLVMAGLNLLVNFR